MILARIGCKCGELLCNSLVPNNIQYWVYSDKKIDKICEKDSIKVKKLITIEDYEVWLCPKCKRLYVFENGEATTKFVYNLEEIL